MTTKTLQLVEDRAKALIGTACTIKNKEGLYTIKDYKIANGIFSLITDVRSFDVDCFNALKLLDNLVPTPVCETVKQQEPEPQDTTTHEPEASQIKPTIIDLHIDLEPLVRDYGKLQSRLDDLQDGLKDGQPVLAARWVELDEAHSTEIYQRAIEQTQARMQEKSDEFKQKLREFLEQ